MEEEASGDHVFPAGGGELILHGDVLMAGEDALEERLFFEILDEFPCGRIFFLGQEIPSEVGQGGVCQGTICVPEPVGGPPYVIRVERHMHA